MNELFVVEEEILHCIENNSKNDNFKFNLRIREDEKIEILKGFKEHKDFFEKELNKVIGDCNVLIESDDMCELVVSVRKINQ